MALAGAATSRAPVIMTAMAGVAPPSGGQVMMGNIASEGEAAEGGSTSAINPRLTQRLRAWRDYRANGGTLGMGDWVSRTQGAPWGTGFKSGYGDWIGSAESPHGNSALSTRTAYLYRVEDADGNLLKWGVTQDLNGRYTGEFLEDKNVFPIAQGRRADMLRLERDLVETYPGPMNNEPWAGKRLGGW